MNKIVPYTRTYYDFSSALSMIRAGAKMARYGFTKHHNKWVELHPGYAATMSHLILVYPVSDRYPGGAVVPWLPSRCDLLEDDWYVI